MAQRKIVWSHKADIKLFEILGFYTNRNKSNKYSAKLYKSFIRELKLVDKHPDIGIKTDFSEIRG